MSDVEGTYNVHGERLPVWSGADYRWWSQMGARVIDGTYICINGISMSDGFERVLFIAGLEYKFGAWNENDFWVDIHNMKELDKFITCLNSTYEGFKWMYDRDAYERFFDVHN